MEPVVEPNEEAQLDFAGPLTDDLNRDAYTLVALHKWSKFPTAKVVSNITAELALKIMQRYFSKNGYPEDYGVIRHKHLEQKNFFLPHKQQHKTIFCTGR